MRYAGGRPVGRLCCWAILMVAVCGLGVARARAAADPQSGPATTTVTDTVYQADGSAAQGNLIIEWPAFVTASGAQVAAGSTNTALASNGTFSVALVPNAGAVPAGAYYSVIYQIGPGLCADRVLDGADDFSGEPGGGADYTGIGRGGTAGFFAVRKFGAGDEGE